jgi:hypothetical protein
LSTTRDDLNGSIARTHEEVVALAKHGERSYFVSAPKYRQSELTTISDSPPVNATPAPTTSPFGNQGSNPAPFAPQIAPPPPNQ